MDETELAFYSNASLVGKCYKSCPLECTEVNYDLTISSSTFPTEWYAEILARNQRFNWTINAYFAAKNISFINYLNDYEGLKNSIARVNVFYKDLRYTLVEESPAMSVAALFGTLGGNWGLLLGNSEYFCVLIFSIILTYF
jgi:hypothetical protein